MRLRVLGTGDAIGTPKVGCRCDNCTTAESTGRQRLRTSLLVEADGRHILIDSSPDLRQQLLAAGSPHIDAVIWTHGHYDHFVGYNEFYRVQKMPPVYAASPVLDYGMSHLHFLKFDGIALPVDTPTEIFGVTFTLFEVTHPPVYACGVRIDYDGATIVHTGDTNRNIPKRSLVQMDGPDLLFVDSIVPPGITIGKHMNYDEACSLARELGAGDFRCVHMSHLIPWHLPQVGEDGEEFEF